jgi:hypothetical protein
MLRRPLALLAIASLALIPLSSAHSATIENSKCTIQNQQKTVSKVSYRCIPVNNKLVWRKVDMLVEAINKKMATYLPKLSLADADPALIGSYVIDPAIPTALAKKYRANAELILRKVALAQPILHMNKPATLLISTNSKWLADKVDKDFPNCLDTKWISEQKAPYWWAALGCFYSTPVQVLPIDPPEPEKIITGFGSDLGYAPIGFWTGQHQDLPSWFVRGLKTVVAEYIDSLGGTTWKAQSWWLGNCKKATLADLSMPASETTSLYGRECTGGVGVNVMRYWVAKYGFAETLAYSVEVHKTGEFHPEEFLGMPLSQFQAAAFDYMKRTDNWPK